MQVTGNITKEGMGYGMMAIIALIVFCLLCSSSISSYMAYKYK